MAIGQPPRLHEVQPIGRAARWRRHGGHGSAQVQRGGRHQRGRRSTTQQDAHACESDAGLPVVSQELAEPGSKIGDEAQVRDKQGKVAHRQGAPAQAASGQQHDQTRAHAHRVGRDGVQSLRRQAIGQHGCTALLVQPSEARHGSLFGASSLHRLHRRQDIADGSGDLAGSLAAGCTVTAQRGARPPRYCHHDHQRQDGDQGHADVDMQEHQERPHGKQALAHNLVRPIQVVLGLKGIVAKAADGLAYGVGQSMGAWPVQDVPQQVAAQQPAHREPQDDFDKASGEPHGHTAHGEHHQQHDQSRYAHGQVCLPGERIEEGAGDLSLQEERQAERAPQYRVE